MKRIVQAVYPAFTSEGDERVREAALDILRYLPARSVREIQLALDVAEDAGDRAVQLACALALQYAQPETPDAWNALEAGKGSRVDAVREAVEEKLKNR